MKYPEDRPITESSPAGHWVHHPVLGKKLHAAMGELGLESYLEIKGGSRS